MNDVKQTAISTAAGDESGQENSFSKGRVEAFSDGVFAVAITLLVLDIHIQDGVEPGKLWHAMTSTEIGIQYLAYAISFLTIGVMWVNHHRLMSMVKTVDHSLLYRNLFLLGAVCFIPFPTSVLAQYVHGENAGEGNMRAAVALYGLANVLLSVAFTLLWGHLNFRPQLLQSWVSRATIRREFIRSASAIGVFAAATAIDIIAPLVTLILFAVFILALAALRPRQSPSQPVTT